MKVENIGNSYDQTVYGIGESDGKSKESVSVNTSVNPQDTYVHFNEETYFTYTSSGAIAGDNFSSPGNEKSCILPERYKENELRAKVYYQGNPTTYYELLQIAVETGAFTLDESQTVWWNADNARIALIDSKAAPLYDWSTKLYSEDGMYVYRVENGMITGARITKFSDGTTFQDLANDIANGTPLSELDHYKLHDLRFYDSELYDAAVNIGRAKGRYDTFTDMYQNGELTEKQFRHDCYPLLLFLFGKDADINNKEQFLQLSDFFEQNRDGFLKTAFENYNLSNQSLVDDLLIEKKYHSYSGLY